MDNLTPFDAEFFNELDAHLTTESSEKWNGFYENRAKPVPFFVDFPDESLFEWVTLGIIKGQQAIDIGCGNARNSLFLAKNDWNVVGVDYSQTAIDWAKERTSQFDLQLKLVCQSIFDLEFVPNQFDLVYDSGCFHHIAPHRRGQYCEIVKRLLKPGGWFGLVCFKPEGGSGLTDSEVYEKQTMGGGLGFTEAQLMEIWSPWMTIESIRPMKKQNESDGKFGEDFLWVMLAKRV